MGEILHFHVNTHDVGYLPDADDAATYEAVDDAIQDVIDRLGRWVEDASQHPADMPIRGQSKAAEPWTYGEEVEAMRQELQTLVMHRKTNDLSLQVAREGLLIPIETGWAVIEIESCSMPECEEHRDEWVT